MKKFEIALVDSKYPMNIGSVARTMACLSYSKLNLISPKCDYTAMDAVKFALFGEDILKSAKRYETLSQLKNEGSVLFGFSRRIGKHRRYPITLTALFNFIESLHCNKNIYIVIGGESAGLSNEQIDLCDYIVTIDNDLVSESLSVPQAAALIMYELSRASKFSKEKLVKQDLNTSEQAFALSSKIRQNLKRTGFIDNKDSKRIMVVIERMLEKLNLRDIRLLHSIIKRFEK